MLENKTIRSPRRGMAYTALAWLIGCVSLGGWLLTAGLPEQKDTQPTIAALAAPPTPQFITKNIEDIRIGDYVLAKDPEDPEPPRLHKVIDLPRNWTEHIVHVKVQGGGDLQSTRMHPLWVDGKGWTPANELIPGDRLRDATNRLVEVESVRIENRVSNTFNLTVQNVHTFYALAGGLPVLVHNQTKTFQTYTKPDPNGGPPYSGRTSGTGTPDQNVAARDSGHAMTDEGYGPAELDQSSTSYDAIRGREQQLIDQNGGAQSGGGTSPNKYRGVSESNPNADTYDQAANDEFGPCE